MLIEFRIKNFRSFKEEQVFSMVAGKDNSLPENTFEAGGFDLLKASALYGHNASGKSNLLKGLFVMRKIIRTSTNLNLSETFSLINSFVFDENYRNEPSKFEVTFLIEKIRYQYGFSATQKRIYDEWLYAYPKKKPQKWFERKFDKINNITNWYININQIKGGEESLNKLKEKTRDNSLFLSVCSQWNNSQLSKVYEWFNNILRVVIMKSDLENITASYLYDSANDLENENAKYYKEAIINGMKIADLGISDIKVEKSKMNIPPEFLNKLKEDSKEEIMETLKDKEMLKTTFIHKLEGESTYPLPFAEESIGTQDYFNLLGPWLDALVNGYTVFIDELETSLHPLLVNHLLKFVNNDKLNNNGAQIIFTSHETTLLNSDLLRRDQIWFTEKENNGSTKLYSLLEYKPRKGEALQKGYLSGRYGAIPILEDFEIYDN